MEIMKAWIWRRNLDFAAIQDIHSIKRQINAKQAQKGKTGANFLNFNVKLGHGGIREIEFFAQTQQLVYGGREILLRNPAPSARWRPSRKRGISRQTCAIIFQRLTCFCGVSSTGCKWSTTGKRTACPQAKAFSTNFRASWNTTHRKNSRLILKNIPAR